MTDQQKRIVDFEHPWLGLESFSEQTKQFFYGRDEEVRDLFLRVRENPLTVLYGQSGLGKSSLLGAGLIPKLRIEGFRPYLLRFDFESANRLGLVQQTRQAFAAALAGDTRALTGMSASVLESDLTLWENFHRDPNPIEGLHESPPVLIVDQFEELFTLADRFERSREAEDLLRQLADLIENRPPFELQERFRSDPSLKRGYTWSPSPVRIVLALRDDYLSQLQGWKNVMPAVMRNQMALHLLTGPQALQAVVRPGRLGGRELATEEVGARIVRFVAKRRPDTPLEEIVAVPPLVSLVCDELNNARLAAGDGSITSDRVDAQSANILQSFYEQSFEGWHASVRHFVEDRLITVGGHRIPVAREDAEAELAAAGTMEPTAAIRHLVQRRLLVPEERGGVQQLWITHDVLTPLVVRSRDERRERERVRQVEQQAQQLRQERRRALAVATVFGILLIISILAGLYGWSQARIASAQAKAAQQAGQESDRQRKLAERREQEAEAAIALQAEARAEAEIQKAAAETNASHLEASLARADYFLALTRWNEGRVAEAQRLLWRIPARHRHFEWYLDNSLFTGGYMTLYDHTSFVYSVAVSPDGKTIASGSGDGTLVLWDAVSGQFIRRLAVGKVRIEKIALSADGTVLVAADGNNTIRLWDVATGQERYQLTGQTRPGLDLAISPDGTRLVSTSSDETIKLWDAASGTELRTITVEESSPTCVAFSPDGTRIAVGTDTGKIRFWEIGSGQEKPTLDAHDSRVTCLAFSPDGKRMASGCIYGMFGAPSGEQSVRLWDASSGDLLSEIVGHQSNISCVAFSPDGAWLATGGADNAIKLWSSATGQELRTLKGHTGQVNSLAFRPDGAGLVSGSWDKTIKLWDLLNEQECDTWRGHQGQVSTVAFNPAGTLLASGGADDLFWDVDRTVKLWDVASGKVPRTLAGHEASIARLAFSPDGTRIASAGGTDQTIRLWDVNHGAELLTLKVDSLHAGDVYFSPDGGTLVSALVPWASQIKRWDAVTGQERPDLKLDTEEDDEYYSLSSLALSPDGTRLATGTGDGGIRLWDANSGEKLHAFPADGVKVGQVVFSPDGGQIASISVRGQFGEESVVSVWDAVSGARMFTLPRQEEQVVGLAFSSDGTRIATAGDTMSVKLWDASNGQELRTLKGHSLSITSLSFSPDGTRLASSSRDQTIKLWDGARGMECRVLEGDDYTSLVTSPDGTRIAGAIFWENAIQLWDTATGKRLRQFVGHTDSILSVAFSPDGACLVSVSEDTTIKLWDVSSGRELRTFVGHQGLIESIAFNADGTRILSRESDGTPIVWDMATGLQVTAEANELWHSPPTDFTDERWQVLSSDNEFLLIDRQFKHTPRELEHLQRKARRDPLWHFEQAESFATAELWYQALFHRAWVVESLRLDNRSNEQPFIDAPERLREAYARWRASLQPAANESLVDPDILLPFRVREVLRSLEPKE